MKLYYIPGACSLAPHIVCNELDLEVELVKVDHKTHTTEDGRDFRELSPFGYVPLLELDDGVTLREGPAILQYLADLKPEAGLAAPNGSMARYQLQEWLGFLNSEIHKGFIPLLYAVLAGKYVTDSAKPKLEQRYAWIDELLGQAGWLQSVYRADIHFDGLIHLQGWYLRMRERPAIRQALAAEGLQR